MIRIGILGDIGSGKSFVAKNFGYPIFNADNEVAKLYKRDKKVFKKLKKILPKYIHSFPTNKNEVSSAILADKKNFKKIIKIIHLEIEKRLKNFLSKNNNKKIVILDIPLLLENKINKKGDFLVFVQSKKKDVLKRLTKRKNFNQKLINKFRNVQLALDLKKRKSDYIIKNNFTKLTIQKHVKDILNKILKWKK